VNSDLVDALEAAIDGRLAQTQLSWSHGASACVIASSGGYPGSYKTGLPILGLGSASQVPASRFSIRARRWLGQAAYSRGRVLGVTAAGDSLKEALARAYQAMAEIHFEGMYYRRDIGHRALKPGTDRRQERP